MTDSSHSAIDKTNDALNTGVVGASHQPFHSSLNSGHKFECMECPQRDQVKDFEKSSFLKQIWNWFSPTKTKLEDNPIKPAVELSTDISCHLCTRPINSIFYKMDGKPWVYDWKIKRRQLDCFTKEQHPLDNAEPINLLSLDGGGVRGYLTVRILQRILKLESEVAHVRNEELMSKGTSMDEIFSLPISAEQHVFARRFNYITGTSTGGLIAFALATDYPLDEMKKFYADKSFFNNHWFAFQGFTRPRYNPNRIHRKIDEVILHAIQKYNNAIDKLASDIPGVRIKVSHWTTLDEILGPDDLKIKTISQKESSVAASARERCNVLSIPTLDTNPRIRSPPPVNQSGYDLCDFTLGHLNLLLNVDYISEQYNYYQQLRPSQENQSSLSILSIQKPHYKQSLPTGVRYRSLLIPVFNTSNNKVTIYNSGLRYHSRMPVVHVLKGTMAAPTFFPIYQGYRPSFGSTSYVDGGLFANNPELVAYLISQRSQNQDVIEVYSDSSGDVKSSFTCNHVRIYPRMAWADVPTAIPRNILALGTGVAELTTEAENNNGSVWSWLLWNKGLLINATLEANRSFMERMMAQLASEHHLKINRMRFNFKLSEQFKLDDTGFCKLVDDAFESQSALQEQKKNEDSHPNVTFPNTSLTSVTPSYLTSKPPLNEAGAAGEVDHPHDGSAEWRSLYAFYKEIIQNH